MQSARSTYKICQGITVLFAGDNISLELLGHCTMVEARDNVYDIVSPLNIAALVGTMITAISLVVNIVWQREAVQSRLAHEPSPRGVG